MATSKARKFRPRWIRSRPKSASPRPSLKDLEQKHKEAENEEIVDIVRGMSIPLEELPLMLQKLRGASGQGGQKSSPAEREAAE